MPSFILPDFSTDGHTFGTVAIIGTVEGTLVMGERYTNTNTLGYVVALFDPDGNLIENTVRHFAEGPTRANRVEARATLFGRASGDPIWS